MADGRNDTSACRIALALLVVLVASCASAGSSPSPPGSVAPTASATASRPSPSPTVTPPSEWVRVTGESLRHAALSRIVAGPAGWLAIGSSYANPTADTMTALWSADGRTWLRSEFHGAGARAGDVVALDDGFLVLGSVPVGDRVQGVAWRTTDGVTWTSSVIAGLTEQPFAATRVGSGVVALAIRTASGGEPTVAWTTADKSTWRTNPIGPGYAYVTGLLTCCDGQVLAFGRYSPTAVDVVPRAPGRHALWSTTDGATWALANEDPAFANAYVEDVVELRDGTLVALGRSWQPTDPLDAPTSAAAWRSADGTTWTAAPLPAFDPAAQHRVVADDRGGATILTQTETGEAVIAAHTTDGRTWTPIEETVLGGGTVADLATMDATTIAIGQTQSDGDPPDGDALIWIGPPVP